MKRQARAWDEESYEQAFASIIDNFHQYVPESSILVVGPAGSLGAQHRAWHPYAGTDRIIDAQRAVCRTHGCAYWDQRKRMGGFGAMQEWVYAGWAQPDHTHFTGEGYRELADALLIDLETGYQAYKKRPNRKQCNYRTRSGSWKRKHESLKFFKKLAVKRSSPALMNRCLSRGYWIPLLSPILLLAWKRSLA